MKVRFNFLNGNMDFIGEVAKTAKLETNFILGELANNKGRADQPQYEVNIYSILMVKMLQQLRNKVKQPVVINSGYRQADYNAKIGGDKNSGHLRGWAADIQKLKNITDDSMIVYWQNICIDNAVIGAINLYDTYYHLEIKSDVLYGAVNFEIRDKRS